MAAMTYNFKTTKAFKGIAVLTGYKFFTPIGVDLYVSEPSCLVLCAHSNIATPFFPLAIKCKAEKTVPFKVSEVSFTMEQIGLLQQRLFILSSTKMKVSSPHHWSAENVCDPKFIQSLDCTDSDSGPFRNIYKYINKHYLYILYVYITNPFQIKGTC